MILERNEDWYDGAPALAHAVYRIFAGNPMQMYETGEIDLTSIYVNNIDRARDPANALNNDLIEGTELCTSYLGFNTSHPPFDDPKVRQALALAMEADKQLEVTYKGLAERAAGFVPPGMFAHNDRAAPSRFDLEAAKQLLRESRYGGAENLPPITSYARDEAIHWAWREHLGLEVEAVSVFEFSDFLERLDNEEYGVFAAWCAPTTRTRRTFWMCSSTARALRTDLGMRIRMWTRCYWRRPWSWTPSAEPASIR